MITMGQYTGAMAAILKITLLQVLTNSQVTYNGEQNGGKLVHISTTKNANSIDESDNNSPKTLPESHNGLVAFYSFDNDASDSSGNNINGSSTGITASNGRMQPLIDSETKWLQF